ncbi:hypothetical protein KL906_004442 [Ogataea polymorpha]|uniref:Protein kinase domain-containing protein n=1 Tax=Ogataea polymorpha TaxID=460523 RepID=A0A9P8PPK3_9ASCO|nr:hypothetical protein KL906_004442 [Ogataea polymorpha]KAG7914381.1 hypothetical protein KL927_004575 [Ogataea polymorpha]KAH3675240.1 hypothetical protein OGATHE_001580 [Ogataea polymorpha]
MFKVFKGTGIESSYSISANPLFVSNNTWTIYPAKHRTTKKKVSVWQFSKKDLEARLQANGVLNRTNRSMIMDDIFAVLGNYVSNLSKFKHPNFLTVIEPLEDHKNRMLFVTEYVVDDLATLNKSDLDEIIITKGLLQIASGLKFLHQSVHTVHMNLAPSSIFITENFDWKISGMQFIEVMENKIQEKYVDPLDSRLPSFLSIDFRYSSPNLLLKHNVDYINDLFSVGCLIYYLFNEGRSLLECSSSSLLEYERTFNKLKHILGSANLYHHASFNSIPRNYIDVFIRMLKETQESNKDVLMLQPPLTVDDLLASAIFNNDLIRILNVIDEFPTLSQQEKIEYLMNLTKDLSNFPRALLINKFIPVLSDLIIPLLSAKSVNEDDQKVIILASQNLLILSNQISQLTFSDKIFPLLNKILNEQNLPSYDLLLVSNIDTIKTKLGANETDSGSKHTQLFQKLLNKLFEKSMVARNDPNTVQLQEKVLTSLHVFLNYQTYSTITTQMFPAVCQLFSTTSSLKIKNLTIKAFILMISGMKEKNLDNYVIVEKLLPLLQNTHVSNFKNANLLMNMVQLYESIFHKLNKSPTTISVGKNEVCVSELIRDSIFFQLWKLTNFVSRKGDLDGLFRIIGEIESYLKKSVTAKLKETDADSSLQPGVINHAPSAPAPAKPLDDFEDFQAAPSKSAPLRLQPIKQYTPPVAQAAQAVNLSTLSFGATSTQPPAANSQQTFAVMQPMKATKVSSPQPSPAATPAPTSPAIDWTKTMAPKLRTGAASYESLI